MAHHPDAGPARPDGHGGLRYIRAVQSSGVFRSASPEQRLQGLVDSAMDAILTVDAQQRIVLFNRAAEQAFGWPADEVLGQPLSLLIPQRFRDGHQGQIDRFGATGVSSRRMGRAAVVRGLRRNGEEFPLEASISQIDTPDGKLFTVILRDVSERMAVQAELQRFAAQAHKIREAEKSRVARELHDELAQSLTALKMDAQWLRERVQQFHAEMGDDRCVPIDARLAAMQSMLDTTVAATRRIAADLRPLLLDDLGLVPALEWLAHRFTERHGIPVELALDESLEPDPVHATALFRIVQESLANVGKHAHARRVTLELAPLTGRPGWLRAVVSDDGTGFDTSAPRQPQSLGLMGLRERVQLVGGEIVVQSTPGQGTRIEVHAPLMPLPDTAPHAGLDGAHP